MNTNVVNISRANLISILFLFVCFISLTVSAVKSGDIMVFGELQRGATWKDFEMYTEPLRLNRFNFTQIVYPIFGISLYLFIVQEIKYVKDLAKGINILVWGALATGFMSILSSILFVLNKEFVYYELVNLFQASKISEPGFRIGIFRSTTIAGEPGYTAITLLIGLGLIVGSMMGRSVERSALIKSPRLKLFVLAVALFINGSTTGYFGFAILFVCTIIIAWYLNYKYKQKIRYVLFFVGSGVIIWFIGSAIHISGTTFNEWIFDYHVQKVMGVSGSGALRAKVSWYTLRKVFLASPIIGVGYGSHMSLSLITFILSNIGLIGMLIFLAFIFATVRNAATVARRDRGLVSMAAVSMILTSLSLFATLFVAKSAVGFVFGTPWVVLAFTESTYQVYRYQVLQ